jgi:RimJ/RimL family protein N-acetyltransferase
VLREKKAYLIESERICLRAVSLADANENYQCWLNTPEITRFLESRFHPTSLEQLQNYVKGMSEDSRNFFLAIILKRDERHVGNIKLGPVDWIHRTAELGILIGERDCWGQGYATEAIKAVVEFAFDTLNLHKITAGAYSANEGSIKAFQKAGFEIEGVRKEQFYCEGKYLDGVLLGRLRDQSTD